MKTLDGRVPLYVAGYPKSGLTWLTRLMADVLNSPSGASVPEGDKNEPATEGKGRPGKYVVRKGHYKLINCQGALPVPTPHRLCYKNLTNEPVIFITRDPRDICLSAAHYHSKDVKAIATNMIDGKMYGLTRWDLYIEEWINIMGCTACFTSYDVLLKRTRTEVNRILGHLSLTHDATRVTKAIERQSFASIKVRISTQGHKMTGGKAINEKLVRSGKAGGWKKGLDKTIVTKLNNEFGEMMKLFGYL